MKQINIAKTRVCVKSVKNIRGAGVSVLCESETDVNNLSKEIIQKHKDDLIITKPKKKFPAFSFFLTGVDHDFTEISEDLIAKNELPDEPNSIKIVHHYKTRNGNTIVIVEVSPNTYRHIVNKKYMLFLGWSYVHLRERDYVMQCFMCQRYGHKASNCHYEVNKNPAVRCKQCGSNHEHTNCQLPASCCNCNEYNKIATQRRWDLIDTNHAADFKLCPSRIKAIHRAKQYVQY